MKKLPLSLLILAVIYISMTFFIGGMVEKQIKTTLSENNQSDFSIKLISYQRSLFNAQATSKVSIPIDAKTNIILNVSSTISHYPHQAIIENNIQLADPVLAAKAQKYFNTTNWLVSEEKVDLFANLSGMLTLAPGKYESANERLVTEPVLLSYQIDLNNDSGAMQLDWAGLIGVSDEVNVGLNRLQLSARIENDEKQSDDYYLTIKELILQQQEGHSLLKGFALKGRSELGNTAKTVDMYNEFALQSYQFTADTQKTFTNNRMKFALTGLYAPALDRLNSGSDNSQEIDNAFLDLVEHGMQLTLSELNSQTPWGEVDGAFAITLDEGASFTDIIANPYILFDYMSGDARLTLPVALLDEPTVAEPLQMGLITGFLLQEEQTLNLQTSFLQGELVVNGQVIPL